MSRLRTPIAPIGKGRYAVGTRRPAPADNRVAAVLRHTVGPDVLHIGASGQANLRSDFSSPHWLHGRLAQHVENLWGLELDSKNVEALRHAGYEQVAQGDAQDLDLPQRFDTVIAGELIEHVERPGDMLSRAAAHLKPGGRIVITTPYAFCALFVAYAWLNYPRTCSNDEHVTWFCPATFSELTRRSGLQVEHYELIENYRPDLPSRNYRAFLRVYRIIRRLVPHRLRGNTMVFVLRPSAPGS